MDLRLRLIILVELNRKKLPKSLVRRRILNGEDMEEHELNVSDFKIRCMAGTRKPSHTNETCHRPLSV
jgi:hypothetical protein